MPTLRGQMNGVGRQLAADQTTDRTDAVLRSR